MKKLGKRLTLHRETLLSLDTGELENLRGGGARRSDSSLQPNCVSECAPGPSVRMDLSCCAASCDDWLM